MLSEPASALTDLALGVVVLGLALRLERIPGVHRYWRQTFWWVGIAAVAGFVHHGWITYSEHWRDVSWAIISGMVVVAVSMLLAATVVEVLGPRWERPFWVLRALSLGAYLVVALTGNAGVEAILICEGVTMIAVLVVWGYAARVRHPLAPGMVVALVASAAAGGLKAAPASLAESVGLDPTSLYHLAQIPGMVLLFVALNAHRSPAPAPQPAGATGRGQSPGFSA